MSWTLLAPAVAIVSTLCVLAWSMHRVELELAALRLSLRRSRAASVALHELERDTSATIANAQQLGRTAQARADLRRTRRRPQRR
ncbi:MAG: hypothetical protein R2707_04310 [Acidimicrobiales bacterium]